MKQKKWLIPAIVGVIILAAAGAAFLLSRPTGDMVMASVEIGATQKTDMGLAADSSFTITTGWRVSREELRAMLDIEPDIGDYTIGGSGKNWTLVPGVPLTDNTVYTIRVINPETKAVVQSFAFQTKSDLAVSGVYPRDGASYVPLEAGIEFTFNAPGVNLKDHFEIKPETAGSFETNDYTVVFRPEEPLSPGSIYRVTVKAGLTAPGGMSLKEDLHFSFETTGEEADRWDYMRLRLAGDYAETFLPGDPLTVALYAGDDMTGLPFDVSLHRYADISGFIREQRDRDAFYAERYGEKTDYVANTTGLEEIASFTGELLPADEYGGELYAPLPDGLEEGCYIATISGKDREGNEQFVQKLLQICNLSVYVQSVDGDTLVWVNDPVTGGPLSGAVLEWEDAESGQTRTATTMADGTARVMTGGTEDAYLSVIRDARTVYFEKTGLSAREDAPLNEKFYTALYTDREIYQPDDAVRFWGVVRPRTGTQGLPQVLWATLGQYGPESEILRVRVPVAADGTFEGSMPLQGIRQDWYAFSVTDGDEGVYTSKGFSIERYQKPAYKITVTPDRDYYYATDPVTFTIEASYYDGTPLSGGELTFSGDYMGSSGPDGLGRTVIRLDEQGRAAHTTKLNLAQMRQDRQSALDWAPLSLWYTVDNSGREDGGYFYESGAITVLPSRIAAKTERDGATGDVTVRTASLDPSRLSQGGTARPLARAVYEDEFDRLAGVPADLPVTLTVHEITYAKVPTGSYYDYVNKRTVTSYRYERGERVVDTLRGGTSGGSAVFTGLSAYAGGGETFYWFEAQFDGGVAGTVADSLRGRIAYPRADGGVSYTFVDGGDPHANDPADAITLGLYANGVKAENRGRILYTAMQRKTLEAGVTDGDEISLTMKEEYLPNVYFAGAYFDGRHVYPIDPHNVSYDYSGKELSLTVTSDREAYRPGDTAEITLAAADAAGNPVSGSAVVGVVDEAVFALAGQTVDLAGQLYGSIYHPYVRQAVSYRAYDESGKAVPNTAAAEGAADTGGGGGGAYLRREFLDTAAFQTAQLGADGKAVLSVKLPDNVTSWRITALAVTPDLKAGNVASRAVATLPFHLTAVVTDSYLAGDDLSMSVAAAGAGIQSGDAVSYTAVILDGTGAEVDRLTGTGRASDYTPFNFGKYEAGSYAVRFEAECGSYSDALQKEFSVVEEGLAVPVVRNLPLSEIGSLEPARYPVRLTVYDERMKPYMEGLQRLTAQDGERTELLVAAYRARAAANELLDPEDRETIRKDYRLESLQEGGGVKPLPLAQGDAAVTAKMLVVAPELLNKADAVAFLHQKLADAASTPDDRVMSYLGLAAAGEPVLLDISRMLEREAASLTASQRLYLGAALAQLGDFTGADAIYESLGEQLVSEGGVKYVEAGGSLDDRIRNTAAALLLTSVASHPDADPLMRFLNGADTDRARSEVLPNLEQLAYIEHFKLPAGESAAKFSVTLDGERREISLAGRGCKSFSLGARALAEADFSGSRDLYACAAYTARTADAGAATGRLRVEKTYTPVGADALARAGVARVDIRVTFAPDAPDGCYTVTDLIPAGMRYLPAQGRQYSGDWTWGSVENEAQTVNGYIYRDRESWEREQRELAAGEADPGYFDEEPEADDGSRGKVIPSSDGAAAGEDPDVCTLTYYVSMPLSGNFVSESVYVTPHTEGLAARSARGTIEIR